MDKILNIEKFIGGWLVGDFEPSLIKTKELEVGVKKIPAGTLGDGHYHKLLTEFTVIIEGHAIDNDKNYFDGDIIVLKPYEKNFTKFIKDTIILSIKSKSIPNDKYY
mgnify:FL=1